MYDATIAIAADAAGMNRHRRILLGQLETIRSLIHKKNDDDSRNVDFKDVSKEDMPRNNENNTEQLAALSTEFLLAALLDLQLLLLCLLDKGEGGVMVPLSVFSDEPASGQEQLIIDAAVAKRAESDAAAAKAKKKKRTADKNKKKRDKRKNRKKEEEEAAKKKKTKLMSCPWPRSGGGIISLIMMIFAFGSSITTLISPFSFSIQIEGSGEGEAPPALPPTGSKPLRQNQLQSNNNAASFDIVSPLPAVSSPPILIFSPAATSNHRMKSDTVSQIRSLV